MSDELSASTAPAAVAAVAADRRGVRLRRPRPARPGRNRHADLFLLPRVGGPSLTPGAYAGLAR